MNIEDTAVGIVEAMCSLQASGLNNGTSGNISVRTKTGMMITPTGIGVDRLQPGMIVPMQLDGMWNHALNPSSEWAMHAEIYKAFPQAQSIVHAHPDHCVALSCLRRPLPAFHYMIASFGGNDVPCSDYAPFGSPELSRAAVDALKDRNSCLLANHGVICHGPSLTVAVARAEKLETLARQFFLSASMGEPVILGDAEMQVVHGRYTTYGRQDATALQEAGSIRAGNA